MAQYSDEDILIGALPLNGERKIREVAPKPRAPRLKKKKMAKPHSSFTTKILDQIAAMEDPAQRGRRFSAEVLDASRQGDRTRYDQLLSKAADLLENKVPHIPDFDTTQAWKPRHRRGSFAERASVHFGVNRGED